MSAPPTAAPLNPLALLPPVPSLDNTFGAFLIATFIGLMLNSRKGLTDRIQEDCFNSNSLNLSALKDRTGSTTAQTWSVPRLHRGSGQMRFPNVDVSTQSTGTMLGIRVDTERAVHADTESIETEHKGLEAK
ncbi:hypothetical protein TRAPUB_3941 [Trametes pubescens]|uniref:Uncharacterized protein n=1 Tax=Trametes pubescens TaxID=154538 RepID=A0A1M2VCM0_TRAPU|nr:hypothetical protein TRAPUB_3941 [Trametes pubescens]